jgi:hypothetical protein
MKTPIPLGIAALLLITSSPTAFGVDDVKSAAPGDFVAEGQVAPITKGLRVFTCAHSFHNFVYPLLAEMALSAGITDHQSVGLSMIGGSRVIQHWDVPDSMNAAKAALRAGSVDVLTLSPIWLPDEGIEKFARLGLEYNPNIRLTVEEFWLPNDTYHPVYPLESRKYVDHNAASMPELQRQNALYRHDIEEYVSELNKRLGRNVVFVVPVGEAADALRERIVRHEVPSLMTQWSLFRDSWGHPTAPLRVLASYCHFAVIYRRSPVGLPMPKEFERNQDYRDEKLNRLLQELAWAAVINNPLSGVAASDGAIHP